MSEKKSVAAEFHKQYRKTSKKRKNEILCEFTMLTGYNRSYAARMLHSNSRKRKTKTKSVKQERRGRKRKYGDNLPVPRKALFI